jgi:hypothetical protein
MDSPNTGGDFMGVFHRFYYTFDFSKERQKRQKTGYGEMRA